MYPGPKGSFQVKLRSMYAESEDDYLMFQMVSEGEVEGKGWREGGGEGWREGKGEGWREGEGEGCREGKGEDWREGEGEGWREGEGEVKLG